MDIAEFAENRQRKLSESYKNTNVNARIIPALANVQQNAADTDQPDTGIPSRVETPSPSPPDYESLSQTALRAVRQIQGNVRLTNQETRDMIRILEPQHPLVRFPRSTLCAIAVVSALLGSATVLLATRERRAGVRR